MLFTNALKPGGLLYRLMLMPATLPAPGVNVAAPGLQPTTALDIANITAMKAGAQHQRGQSRHQRGYGSKWDRLRQIVLDRDKHLVEMPAKWKVYTR